MCNFINAIRADGKGDSAEDIMGGIKAFFSRGDEGAVKVTKVYNLIIVYKIAGQMICKCDCLSKNLTCSHAN